MEVDKVPFSLNRNLATSLTDQVVESFKAAVDAGVYADGAATPSLRALASQLGVSLIVARRAYARLSEDGYLSVRRGFGCRVVGRANKLWRGRVLVVGYGLGEHYVSNSIMSVLRARLLDVGYLVSCVLTQATEGGRLQLEQVLRQRFDLIVSLCDEEPVLKLIEASGSRCVVFYSTACPAAGVVPVRFGDCAAKPDFVAHCLRRGVRTALEISINPRFAPAAEELRAAGVACRRWTIRVCLPDGGRVESVMRRTQRLLERKFARHGKAWLPDVLYFSDDYVATAALLVLVMHGVRIPQDVGIVTWANRGLGPVAPFSLTRVEFDPFAAGERLFEVVSDLLAGKQVMDNIRIDSVYRIGDSFPE